MELKHLKTFQAAAQLLNFTKAAEQLGYTQPTVTAQIQSLENELGHPLFLRVGRKTFLTPTGELVKRYADEILSLAEEMESLLSHQSKLLKIAAPETYCALYFPPLINQFTKEFPDVQISLISCDSGHVKEGIETNQFDIGVISGELFKSGIINVVLDEEDLQLIVSQTLFENYPLEKLLEHFPFLKYKAQGFLESMMTRFLEQSKLSPKRVIELGSEEATKKAVLNHTGFALLSSSLVKKEVQSGSIVVLDMLDAPIKLKTSFITQKDKFLLRDVQSFYQLLLSNWNDCF